MKLPTKFQNEKWMTNKLWWRSSKKPHFRPPSLCPFCKRLDNWQSNPTIPFAARRSVRVHRHRWLNRCLCDCQIICTNWQLGTNLIVVTCLMGSRFDWYCLRFNDSNSDNKQKQKRHWNPLFQINFATKFIVRFWKWNFVKAC